LKVSKNSTIGMNANKVHQ